MKKRSRVLAALCAAAISLSFATPTFACTPKLNTPSVQVPDINVKFDAQTEKAIENAAKKFVENNTLARPTIQKAYYYHMTMRNGSYGSFSARWDKVENATSYEVKISKADGSEKTFTTSYNMIYLSNYSDDFLDEGLDGSTISVKALGADNAFSLWSDTFPVTAYSF